MGVDWTLNETRNTRRRFATKYEACHYRNHLRARRSGSTGMDRSRNDQPHDNPYTLSSQANHSTAMCREIYGPSPFTHTQRLSMIGRNTFWIGFVRSHAACFHVSWRIAILPNPWTNPLLARPKAIMYASVTCSIWVIVCRGRRHTHWSGRLSPFTPPSGENQYHMIGSLCDSTHTPDIHTRYLAHVAVKTCCCLSAS